MKSVAFSCLLICFTSTLRADDLNFGTLIFEDSFERNESQELKDEPGNEWTTSSEKTAAGHKEVDLRDGAMYIYTHKDANHATSVRHAFTFTDGTVGLRFKLEAEDDLLVLNFADLALKTVHAGHLFRVVVTHEGVRIVDQKTGEMDLELRKAKKSGSLTDEQRRTMSGKAKSFDHPISTNEWHHVYVTVEGKEITCRIDGEVIGRFSSEGFAHEPKKLLRLLVPKNAWVDDVKIWRKK